MIFGKKTGAFFIIAIALVAGIAATTPPEEHKAKNLKVLSKKISHDDLMKVMNEWKEALGVKCGFCHAPSKDSSSHMPDFASDEKPEKNIARSMYKMTKRINKKYFSYEKNEQGETEPVVQCMTCHHGNAHPGPKKS